MLHKNTYKYLLKLWWVKCSCHHKQDYHHQHRDSHVQPALYLYKSITIPCCSYSSLTFVLINSHAKSLSVFNVKTLAATETASRMLPNWKRNVTSGPSIIRLGTVLFVTMPPVPARCWCWWWLCWGCCCWEVWLCWWKWAASAITFYTFGYEIRQCLFFLVILVVFFSKWIDKYPLFFALEILLVCLYYIVFP